MNCWYRTMPYRRQPVDFCRWPIAKTTNRLQVRLFKLESTVIRARKTQPLDGLWVQFPLSFSIALHNLYYQFRSYHHYILLYCDVKCVILLIVFRAGPCSETNFPSCVYFCAVGCELCGKWMPCTICSPITEILKPLGMLGINCW
jgi:hypothetical protein